MKTLITATTNPATSTAITIGSDPSWALPAAPVTLYLTGVPSGDDKVTVQYPDGDTWRDAKIGGQTVALDANTNLRTIYGPLTFRLSKTVTTAAIGATIETTRGV